MKAGWGGWVCAAIAVSLMSLSEWLRPKKGFKA